MSVYSQKKSIMLKNCVSFPSFSFPFLPSFNTLIWHIVCFICFCLLFPFKIFSALCLLILFYFFWVYVSMGFPGSSDSNESAYQCRKPRFDPWVGKIAWRREWLPTPVFLPRKFHGQGSLVGYSLWDWKESGTTEWLSHTHTHSSKS